jgi:hypothetical protein
MIKSSRIKKNQWNIHIQNEDQIWRRKQLKENEIEIKSQFDKLFHIKHRVIKRTYIESERDEILKG